MDGFRELATQNGAEQSVERFDGLAVGQILQQRETDQMRSLFGRLDE